MTSRSIVAGLNAMVRYGAYTNYLGKLSSALPLSVSSRRRHEIVIKEEDITSESFIRGGGPGGQSINKSRNRVRITHSSGISVSCQEARDLSTNRKIARRMLRDKLDAIENGSESKLAKRQQKIQKRKYNASRRAKKKYGEKIIEDTSDLRKDE